MPVARSKRLAVLEIRDDARTTLDDASLAMLTDVMRQLALQETRTYSVITRENLLMLLAAGGLDVGRCSEASCEVEIGRNIGADVVVSGTCARVGSYLFLHFKVHETNAGALRSAQTIKARDVDGLVEQLDAAAARLFEPL